MKLPQARQMMNRLIDLLEQSTETLAAYEKYKEQNKKARDVLATMELCCEEALSGKWDKSDEGFQSMLNDIRKVLEDSHDINTK